MREVIGSDCTSRRALPMVSLFPWAEQEHRQAIHINSYMWCDEAGRIGDGSVLLIRSDPKQHRNLAWHLLDTVESTQVHICLDTGSHKSGTYVNLCTSDVHICEAASWPHVTIYDDIWCISAQATAISHCLQSSNFHPLHTTDVSCWLWLEHS